MARIFKQKPQPKIAVVNTDDKTYDIYLSVPVLIGAVRRVAKYNYGTSDGVTGHLNIPAAVAHILITRGDTEIAQNVAQYMTSRVGVYRVEPDAPVPATVMIGLNVWTTYCKNYGLDPESMENIGKSYKLTLEERKQWGIS